MRHLTPVSQDEGEGREDDQWRGVHFRGPRAKVSASSAAHVLKYEYRTLTSPVQYSTVGAFRISSSFHGVLIVHSNCIALCDHTYCL